MNLHENTVDGLHVASAGGVWGAVVFGFAGMRDTGGRLSFDPRLPDAWSEITFPLCWHGERLRVTVTADALEVGSEGERARRRDHGARRPSTGSRPAARSGSSSTATASGSTARSATHR